MSGSSLDKKQSLNMLGFSLYSKLDLVSNIYAIVKTAPKIVGDFICSMRGFFWDSSLPLKLRHLNLHRILLPSPG